MLAVHPMCVCVYAVEVRRVQRRRQERARGLVDWQERDGDARDRVQEASPEGENSQVESGPG